MAHHIIHVYEAHVMRAKKFRRVALFLKIIQAHIFFPLHPVYKKDGNHLIQNGYIPHRVGVFDIGIKIARQIDSTRFCWIFAFFLWTHNFKVYYKILYFIKGMNN